MEKFEGIVDQHAFSSYTADKQLVFDPLCGIQRYQGILENSRMES